MLTGGELMAGDVTREQQAASNRTRVVEMKCVLKYLHAQAMKLIDEFEALADQDTQVDFWTRDNVVNAIESKDLALLNHWLRVALWQLTRDFGPQAS
jgi:hypothetical protein